MTLIRLRFCKLIVFMVCIVFSVKAQDIKSVDVNSLSDSDIEEVRKAITESGLSESEAISLAKQRGATEEQIKAMRQRLLEGQEENVATSIETFQQTSEFEINESFVPGWLGQESAKFQFKTFGTGLFRNRNLTFQSGVAVQTPKNYEIGIGDKLVINIWGNSQNNYQLTVNRNGQIIVPDLGPIYVAGMLFENAEKKILQRLSSIYSDMRGQNPGTFAQLNMGQLRSITVNIVGEALIPGTYTLPASATVYNALYMSGGPDSIGSYRNIKVFRDNRLFTTVDVYDFLVHADATDNIQLKNEDILIIPPFENQVEVSGEFKRKGLFEMKEGETVEDLLLFTGGFTGKSYHSGLQISRKTQKGISILDIPPAEFSKTTLVNGDSIWAGEISKRYKNKVTITGAVYRPGEYEWVENMTLRELLTKADSIREEAFLNRGLIIRLNEDFTRKTISFDLNKIIRGSEQIMLQRNDSVIIKNRYDLEEKYVVNVAGEVTKPGSFRWSENTTLGDAIFMAGGFTEAADSSFIEVARRLSHEEASELTDDLVHVYTFNLSRDLGLNNGDSEFILEPFDQVAVRRAPGYRKQASVIVTGEIKHEGVYAISNKNMRISDLIKLAGGITPQAYVKGATFTRSTKEMGKETIALKLEEILKVPGKNNDVYLRDGDQLNIPEYMQTVKVVGMVQNPFSIPYEEGKPVKYYIKKCGGYNAKALKNKVYVQYANGSSDTKKSSEIQPGTTIVVPEKSEKVMGKANWLRMTSTFTSMAIAIAAVFR